MKSRPTARLLSTIEHPVETVYCLWKASRTTTPVPSPQQVAEDCATDPATREEVYKTFAEIIHDDFPVSENLDFVFLLEHVPVSLREQMVRHRIGHKFGENFGVDILPGEVGSSWWSQTSRIIDMGQFAAQEEYFTPDTISKDPKTLELYRQVMGVIAVAYQNLVDNGIPREDARQIIPLAATSRISWKLNYMSLKHIVKRRTCWIAQAGMWQGVVHDMVNQLAEKVHPIFRAIAQPPCFNKSDSFIGCPFMGDNMNRVRGNEPYPPCPLFLNHHREEILDMTAVDERIYQPNELTWDTEEPARRQAFQEMQELFEHLWGKNVWTGART